MKALDDLCDADEFQVRLIELATLTKPEHTGEVMLLVTRLKEIFDAFRER